MTARRKEREGGRGRKMEREEDRGGGVGGREGIGSEGRQRRKKQLKSWKLSMHAMTQWNPSS